MKNNRQEKHLPFLCPQSISSLIFQLQASLTPYTRCRAGCRTTKQHHALTLSSSTAQTRIWARFSSTGDPFRPLQQQKGTLGVHQMPLPPFQTSSYQQGGCKGIPGSNQNLPPLFNTFNKGSCCWDPKGTERGSDSPGGWESTLVQCGHVAGVRAPWWKEKKKRNLRKRLFPHLDINFSGMCSSVHSGLGTGGQLFFCLSRRSVFIPHNKKY